MNISVMILKALSRQEGNEYYLVEDLPLDHSLDLLKHEFPNLVDMVNGKRVVDFGCGNGYQAFALSSQMDCTVVGVDTNPKRRQAALGLIDSEKISASKLSIIDKPTQEMWGTFDIVISQNSFEHFEDPLAILNQMKALIKESGKLLIVFGPPWFSPYGSHMGFFCKVPWINILFSEKTVMCVRNGFRDDGATRYEEVESGLNKMSISRFEQIIDSSGMKIESRRYTCVKKLNFLAKIPVFRELFITQVSVTLSIVKQ